MAYLKMYGGRIVQKYKTMTVILDLNNPDPTSWATYADDAMGMTAGSDAWDTFFGHYPCILDNGVELGKLKRNNFGQYEDGTSAPITTLGKDVMICFPRRGIKFEYLDANRLSVSMTDEDNKPGYSYMAHSYKGVACDKFYIGAYEGYHDSNKIYSSGGKTITPPQITFDTYRNRARARGTGYELFAHYQNMFLQIMYTLKYKAQDAQIAVGMGVSTGSNSGVYNPTGYTDDKGMDWGESTGTLPMCLFGIENLYGNYAIVTDGLYSDDLCRYYASDGDYANTSSYVQITTETINSEQHDYLRYPVGTNLGGFLPVCNKLSGSSNTIYFADYTSAYPSKRLITSGYANNGRNCGIYLSYWISLSDMRVNDNARLMYMHTVT